MLRRVPPLTLRALAGIMNADDLTLFPLRYPTIPRSSPSVGDIALDTSDCQPIEPMTGEQC